jgi:hypothetical protein
MTPYPDQGLSPRTAGTLLAVVALLAIGLFIVAASIDGKSSDRLYDPVNREMHTSSDVQMTPDLWKRKGEAAPADAARTPAATPPATPVPPPAIPIRIKRDAGDQQQQQPQKPEQPPSTGPS